MGCALVVASASSAADLRDVRVGLNKDYTRVVLETDSKVAYTLTESGGAVTLQLQASARPQAVAAKGPHVAWVRVEPAGAGATVRLELRKPARVKQMVLTGPNRIVIDVYADETARAAPVAQAKPKPEPVPEPVAAKPPEPTPPAVAEAPKPVPAPDDEAALLAEADAILGPDATPGDEIAANEGATSEDASLDGVDQAAAPETVAAPEEKAPPIRTVTRPSGGLLDLISSPYVLGVLAVVMGGVVLILRKRKPAPAARPETGAEEEPALFPSAERAEPEGAAAAEPTLGATTEPSVAPAPPPAEAGTSAFDFEAPSEPEPEPEKPPIGPARGALLSTIGAVTSTAAVEPPAAREPGGLSLSELERRIALLETRLEEVVDAKDRLERQVSAQTEELRVQRAAIARTQRVLRTVVRPDDEPSEPVLKS